MFGQTPEERYVNSVSHADSGTRAHSQWPVLIAILLGIAAFFVWAALFEIEEVTNGTGRVIPSSQIQVVQTLEGGLVSAINIREGDLVEAEQVLLQIDDTGFSSALGELAEREAALLAERARLEAEAALSESVTFATDLEARSPNAVSAERFVFLSRREQLAGELAVLRDRLVQRQSELSELEARERTTIATLKPLEREVVLTVDLHQRRVVPEIELLRLQSRLEEMKGELEVGAAARPRIEAAIREAENQINTTRGAYILQARERLAQLQGELAQVQEAMRGATDRVTRTQIRAPVRGIVNKLNTTTIGAVVRPGEDIMEIVPVDDGLLIEADIRPQDIAFIGPGDSASVKITAYDYLVYGALDGEVIRIGADSITDDNGDPFFRAVVQTRTNHLERAGSKLPITPGMVASVDVQTGRKTVLSYLMKPILRASSEALRER